MFEKKGGDWTRFRELGDVREIDFHAQEGEHAESSFHERMDEAYRTSLDALRSAQRDGVEYVIFRHGWSTSRSGRMTYRSQIRKLMRSPEATPYIRRTESIQHHAVFVAAIKPK